MQRFRHEEEGFSSLQYPSRPEITYDLLEPRPAYGGIDLLDQCRNRYGLISNRIFESEPAEEGQMFRDAIDLPR